MRFCNRLGVMAWAAACLAQAQPQIDWVQQVKNKPVLDVRQYNFATQRPTSPSSLAVGNNTITFVPVPLGMNGTDTDHYIWIAGTGTPEACLINGGSGLAGQASGTIRVSCAGTHAAGYTVSSKDGGIQEAIQGAKTAGGGVVSIPPGTYSLTAAAQLPSNVTFAGSGQGPTILKVANGALAANASWQVPGQAGVYCIVCLASGSSFERVQDLTIDANGANQTWLYYGDITGYNASNVVIDRVTVTNHPIAGGTGVHFQFLGHSPTSSNANNVIINSNSIGIANCTVPNGGGAYYIEGEGNRILSSSAINHCDSPYVISNCDHCIVADSIADVGSGQMATPTFSIEGAQHTEIHHIQCLGSGTNGHFSCLGVASTPTMQTIGTIISGVSTSHSSATLNIGFNSAWPTAGPTIDTQVSEVTAYNNVLNCINIAQTVNKLSISNSTLDNCGSGGSGSGITITSTGAVAGGSVVQNVAISNVTIDHAFTAGILAASTNSGPPVVGFKLVGSFVGDTAASPITPRSVWLQAGGPVSDVAIAGNTLTGTTAGPLFFQNSWATPAQATVWPNNPLTYTFSTTPLGCSAPFFGNQTAMSDSTTNTWGAAITVGGGANPVLAFCNGTAWTVAAK